jgi:heme exporter protein C
MTGSRSERWLSSFGVLALMLFAGYAALFIAPEELKMREIQRIFYFHVPSAWVAFLAFFIVFVANVSYLLTRRPKWDWLGVAGAEVGLAFCTVVLITGPIWARPVWGVWWAWDPRLTSTLVLWLLYVSYLLLRGLLPDPERQARFCAVFGIFAFLDVPLVYFSIRIWDRLQHPKPVIGGGEESFLNRDMAWVLVYCCVALLALMVVLLRQRYRLEALRHQVAELNLLVEERALEREAAATSSARPLRGGQ